MTPPRDVVRAVERVVGESIATAQRVSGGCISPAARLDGAAGGAWFLKWADGDAPAGLFEAEAAGLEALRATGTVRVPSVVAQRDDWLLLEWLPPGSPGPGTWAELGRALAAFHAHRADAFGAHADNFIGSLPQSNGRMQDWAGFWVNRRLQPQLERAAAAFSRAQRDRFERFIEERLPPLLAAGDADGASLLHGDLWGGNVHVMEGGTAALIDPSAYHGHREVDLAMADLFGGFDRAFHEAYAAEWPLRPGWRERRAAYQLYYLLVHVNLFGSGYVPRTLRALEAAGG